MDKLDPMKDGASKDILEENIQKVLYCGDLLVVYAVDRQR